MKKQILKSERTQQIKGDKSILKILTFFCQSQSSSMVKALPSFLFLRFCFFFGKWFGSSPRNRVKMKVGGDIIDDVSFLCQAHVNAWKSSSACECIDNDSGACEHVKVEAAMPVVSVVCDQAFGVDFSGFYRSRATGSSGSLIFYEMMTSFVQMVRRSPRYLKLVAAHGGA